MIGASKLSANGHKGHPSRERPESIIQADHKVREVDRSVRTGDFRDGTSNQDIKTDMNIRRGFFFGLQKWKKIKIEIKITLCLQQELYKFN